MTGLSLTQASEIVDAALSHARDLGLRPLTITVLDPGATPRSSNGRTARASCARRSRTPRHGAASAPARAARPGRGTRPVTPPSSPPWPRSPRAASLLPGAVCSSGTRRASCSARWASAASGRRTTSSSPSSEWNRPAWWPTRADRAGRPGSALGTGRIPVSTTGHGCTPVRSRIPRGAPGAPRTASKCPHGQPMGN